MIGAEHVPAAQKFAPEFMMVVDFPVKNDTDGFLGVPHRLGAAFEVQDRQTPVSEEHGLLFVLPKAVAVGAAMRQRARHGGNQGRGSRSRDTGYSAHRFGLVLVLDIGGVANNVGRLVLAFEIDAHHQFRQQAHQNADDPGQEGEGR